MVDDRGLRIFAVEDEALLLMTLEAVAKAAGHSVTASAMSSSEAMSAAPTVDADLAIVDLHLADGHTGLALGRHLTRASRIPVVYLTADVRHIPAMAATAGGVEPEIVTREDVANDAGGDYAGAVGVIAKPYTVQGLNQALAYLADALLLETPTGPKPDALFITPAYAARWGAAR